MSPQHQVTTTASVQAWSTGVPTANDGTRATRLSLGTRALTFAPPACFGSFRSDYPFTSHVLCLLGTRDAHTPHSCRVCVLIVVCCVAAHQTGVDARVPEAQRARVPIVYGQAFYIEHVATRRLLVASQQFSCGFDPDARRLELQPESAVRQHHVPGMFTLQPRFKVLLQACLTFDVSGVQHDMMTSLVVWRCVRVVWCGVTARSARKAM